MAYIQGHTAPDDVVISDYPGLNFYARRASMPIAAGISRGAAASGQIMGANLIGEIEASHAEMVLLNVAQGAHQFSHLLDYPVSSSTSRRTFTWTSGASTTIASSRSIPARIIGRARSWT